MILPRNPPQHRGHGNPIAASPNVSIVGFISKEVNHHTQEMTTQDGCRGLSFELRDFRMDDYDRVIELWRICGLPFRPSGRDSKERIAVEIRRPMALFLVAECEGELVGTLFGTTDGRKGWINRLAVRPDCRGRGIATRLIKEMEARFELLGLEVFSCLIEDRSDSSMRLFEQLGYEEDPSVHYFSRRINKGS